MIGNEISYDVERTLRGHKDFITSVAFNPSQFVPSNKSRKNKVSNYLQVASSSIDGTVMIWNVYESKQEDIRAYRFYGHTAAVNRICYSPSGSLLASCSSDSTVRLWVPKVNGDHVVLKGHTGPVRGIDFNLHDATIGENGEESVLLTCSDDKTVKLWKLPDKSFIRSFTGHTNFVNSVRFSPDTSNICASGSDDGTTKLWDINTGVNVVTYSFNNVERKNGVKHVLFNPSGNIVASCVSDGSIHHVDLRSDRIIYKMYEKQSSTLATTRSSVGGVDFHPNSHYFVSSRENSFEHDHSYDIWDLRKQDCILSVRHGHQIVDVNSRSNKQIGSTCCFSSNGNRLLTGGPNKDICIWKLKLGTASILKESGVPDSHIKASTRRIQSPGKPNSADKNQNTCSSDLPSTKSNFEESPHKLQTATIGHVDDENKDETSTVLIRALNHIVGQIDLMTQTISLIEKRLSIQEDSLASLKEQMERCCWKGHNEYDEQKM